MLIRGTSYRTITGRFQLSQSAIQRHVAEHLRDRVQHAKQRADKGFVDHVQDAVDSARVGVQAGMEALPSVDVETRARLTPAFMAQHTKLLDLLGRATGQLEQAPTTSNVLIQVVLPRPEDTSAPCIDIAPIPRIP